eukprot:146523-Amphidinium_carterae.1
MYNITYMHWDFPIFDFQSLFFVKDDRKAALNAALGGVWHEARAHAAFQVGHLCVRCGEAVEDLKHAVPLPTHEPAVVKRHGVHTVWTDGSGRHSRNPHFRRCWVGYVTNSEERVWLPPGFQQAVLGAASCAGGCLTLSCAG